MTSPQPLPSWCDLTHDQRQALGESIERVLSCVEQYVELNRYDRSELAETLADFGMFLMVSGLGDLEHVPTNGRYLFVQAISDTCDAETKDEMRRALRFVYGRDNPWSHKFLEAAPTVPISTARRTDQAEPSLSGESMQHSNALMARAKAAHGSAHASNYLPLLPADLELAPALEETMRREAIELLRRAEDGLRRASPYLVLPVSDADRESAADTLVLFGCFLVAKKWGQLHSPAPCSGTVFLESLAVARCRDEFEIAAGILDACYGNWPWVNESQRVALQPMFAAPASTQ